MQVVSPIDFRRKNKIRVPLFGGLAVYFSVLTGAYFFPESSALTICLCASPIVLSGIVDDLYELGSLPKLLAQVLAVVLFIFTHPDGTLLLEQLGLPEWPAALVTGFWIIGVTNAFNFIDGMDGEAAGIAIIAALTLAFMSQYSPNSTVGMMIAGAGLAFLFFNWPNAKIYLGDSGSTFFGFTLSAIASTVSMRHIHFAWIAAPMFVLAIPQIDAMLAMYRRARLGLSLFKGDHDHIHHKLQKIGFTVRQSLAVIYGVAIYCSATAICLFYTSNIRFALATLFLSSIALMAILGGIYFVQLRLAQQISSYSQTLIQKYFNIKENLIFDPNEFSAVVFDLLPYYKELQQRGILIVDSFISSFSRIVERRCEGAQVRMLGSYSVVIVLPEVQNRKETYGKLVGDFHSLLNDFGAVRSESPIPEGVHLYNEDHNRHEFESLMNRFPQTQKKAA